MPVLVTAWNNGWFHRNGAGYGLRIEAADRERYFSVRWNAIRLSLPGDPLEVEINTDNSLFRLSDYGVLVSKAFGQWMIAQGSAPWLAHETPRFVLEPGEANRFSLQVYGATESASVEPTPLYNAALRNAVREVDKT